jgi:hypothetical protein
MLQSPTLRLDGTYRSALGAFEDRFKPVFRDATVSRQLRDHRHEEDREEWGLGGEEGPRAGKAFDASGQTVQTFQNIGV